MSPADKQWYSVSLAEKILHTLRGKHGYHAKRPITTRIEFCAVCHRVLTTHIDPKEVDEAKLDSC